MRNVVYYRKTKIEFVHKTKQSTQLAQSNLTNSTRHDCDGSSSTDDISGIDNSNSGVGHIYC